MFTEIKIDNIAAYVKESADQMPSVMDESLKQVADIQESHQTAFRLGWVKCLNHLTDTILKGNSQRLEETESRIPTT